MTPDQENFDRLRRLLALKRHEQPPPGYFCHFSQQVILRIKDGETGEQPGIFARWFGESPWLSHVSGLFEARPALGGAVGIAVCGLMLAGIFYSEPEQPRMVVTGAPANVLNLGSAPRLGHPGSVAYPAGFNSSEDWSRRLHESLINQVRPGGQLISHDSLQPAPAVIYQ